MIVAEQKPIAEIINMAFKHKSILVVGCGTCVTVCFAGGEKEVKTLSSLLRMKAQMEQKLLEIQELTVERQCDHEFIEKITPLAGKAEAILSLACGAGVQLIAEKFADKIVYPGLNTTFLGITEKQGVWKERCLGCGTCLIDKTGGICPIARCAKNLLNGPCGGSQEGKCEVNPETDCAWQLIYERLKKLGQLECLEEIIPVKDWSTSRDGGPRKIIREDLTL